MVNEEPPLSETHWPIVASIVANQFIREAKDVVGPKLGAVLVMEAAIAASKVDPKTVPVKQATKPD